MQRIGAATAKRVDVRVIAATNRDLDLMVDEGRFRRDLYFRLSVIALDVPPLRESRDLIGDLLDLFVSRVNKQRVPPLGLDDDCREVLLAHDYPGNIRELANIVEHLSVVAEGDAGPHDLPASVTDKDVADFVDPTRAGPPHGFPEHFSERGSSGLRNATYRRGDQGSWQQTQGCACIGCRYWYRGAQDAAGVRAVSRPRNVMTGGRMWSPSRVCDAPAASVERTTRHFNAARSALQVTTPVQSGERTGLDGQRRWATTNIR